MKKAIVLTLAIVLLISAIGTALALCNHNWHTASTSVTPGYKIYNCSKGSCPNRYASHTHWKTSSKHTTVSVCYNCSTIKTVVYYTYGKDHCSLVDPVPKK